MAMLRDAKTFTVDTGDPRGSVPADICLTSSMDCHLAALQAQGGQYSNDFGGSKLA